MFRHTDNGLKPAVEKTSNYWTGQWRYTHFVTFLAKHGKKSKPLDIELNEKQRILIISGPNAGGKSVLPKDSRLIAIHVAIRTIIIPMHERSHTGIFSSIFIDIGDE